MDTILLICLLIYRLERLMGLVDEKNRIWARQKFRRKSHRKTVQLNDSFLV